MFNKDIILKAGNNSNNFQAENININSGLSYTDVKGIINDVFKENFIILKNEAAQIAKERAEEITEKVLQKLLNEAPNALNEFSKPGMQDSFFNAQKGYAINGGSDLRDMLVEILIDRAKLPTRSRQQIILDESLKLASKLTSDQMDLLTLTFLMFNCKGLNIRNLDDFKNKVISQWEKLLKNLEVTNDDLAFLEYLGLAKVSVASSYFMFEELFKSNYPLLFVKGISPEEMNGHMNYNSINIDDLIITCFQDESKVQFNQETSEDLTTTLRAREVREEIISVAANIHNNYTMQNYEIKNYCLNAFPLFQNLVNIRESTDIQMFHLTGVGMAIAISNYQRHFLTKLDLSIWIKG